jgi:hypothetical protein
MFNQLNRINNNRNSELVLLSKPKGIIQRENSKGDYEVATGLRLIRGE